MITTWYIFKGIKGILADLDNPKLQGITPVHEDDNHGFYPLDALEGRDIETSDCCLEYYGAYRCDDSNVNTEIVCEPVVNVENSQKLIVTFVDKKMYEQDWYDREMKTETDRYYQWHSELTVYIDYVLDAWKSERERLWLCDEDEDHALDNIKNEMEEKWNEVSAPYAALNHYDDAQTFDNVWSMITERVKKLSY